LDKAMQEVQLQGVMQGHLLAAAAAVQERLD
jgi:hypothetical protein